MERLKACWIVVIMLLTGLPARAVDCAVDVFITTGVAIPVLRQAQVKAAAMFHEIGVDVRIRVGSAPHPGAGTCGEPIEILLDDSTGYPGTADALAYAEPFRESGSRVHIFVDRLVGRNRDPGFANILLAHVMVHEITHVLAQSVGHSESGVMKARWSREDYQCMKWHSLPFTREDVEGLRNSLAQRKDSSQRSKVARSE